MKRYLYILILTGIIGIIGIIVNILRIYRSGMDVDVPMNVKLYMKPQPKQENGKMNQTEYQSDKLRICSQSQRKTIVASVCKKYSRPRIGSKKITFVVDHANKVAYCPVQKAGCSTWKLIMANMSTNGSIDANVHLSVHSPKFYARCGLKFTHYVNTASALKALTGYVKLTVMRHPLERLVSGYYDKMIRSRYINTLKLIQRYRKTPIRQRYPTFAEFVSMVTNIRDQASYDRHWRPAEDLCDLCNVDYQYIFKLETMVSDLPVFMREVYPGNKNTNEVQGQKEVKSQNGDWFLNIKRNARSKTDDSVNVTGNIMSEYETLNPILYKRVIDKYSYGMELFGYNYNKATFTGSCGYSEDRTKNCC